MGKKLSFAIAINLLTEQFKRGANQVKATFKALQMQILTFVAALGAGGIGLSNLVSRFVDVARETNRVTTALKNVSGGLAKYADNQRYLLDMAKKYGLEINALTGNFAKFTAAASVSGMTMQEQKKIFESVSRAVTAFGMSADDSNGVFLALSQMMSKGKISSEELRLQMGERLPIALQAMAKAAGTSVAGLDKLLKQGKLMSKDVLPKFAEALNEMIPNIDLDNLETSINRLKNTFTEVVNSTGVQSTYKSLVDWLAKTIASAAENTVNIVIGALALITGAIANHAVKWWTSISSTTSMIEANVAKTNTLLVQATQQRIAAEVALERAKTQSVMAEANARVALDKALQKEKMASDQVAYAEQKAADAKKIVEAQTTARAMLKATRERVAAEIILEATKAEVIAAQNASLQAQTYNDAIAARERLAIAQKNFASAEKTLAQKTAKEVAAAEAAKAAAVEAAAVKSQSVWGRFCNVTKVAVGKLVVQIKAMWAAFKPMIIITAITAVIGKLVAMYKEAKRVRNIFSDYKKSLLVTGNTQEITRIQALAKIMNDRTKSHRAINAAQAELQKMLGVENKSQEELNRLVKDRVTLLKEAAIAEHAFNTVGEYTERNAKLAADVGLNSKQMDRLTKLYAGRNTSERNRSAYQGAVKEELGINGNLNKGITISDVSSAIEKYIQNLSVISDATQRAGEHLGKTIITPTTLLPDDDKKTPLQKQQESYRKQYEELGAELEIGKITQAEYNKALGELNIKMFAQAKGTGDKEVLESEYFRNLRTAAEKAIANQDKNAALVEFEKVQKDYNTKVREAQQQQAKGLASQKKLDENIISLSIEAAKSAAGIKGIGKEADVFIAVMKLNAKLLSSPIKIKPRDTTFDYKKTSSDIASENLDKAKEYAEKLKERYTRLGQEISDEIANGMANVPTLEDALKLAQVREDIKSFSKELNESLYSGVKNIASSSDRMVSAFENLRDVMNDVDASGWERIMAVWNAMTNTIDGIMSICKTIETLTELTNKLARAKEAEAVIDKATADEKVVNAAKGAAATIAETQVEKTAATTEVAANTAKGASAAGASAASLPFPWNIVAIGGAIAAAIAAFAVIPKFAGGGIVSGGPTSGDKILARVNAGEMILNGSQQSNLFEAINSGQLGGGKTLSSTVTTKVRSKDLILTINNELKSQGKKPIS
ncbi:tape measure protein [Bacteroides cellulosilyticus]|jgi:tape measure domain-containing protein|uniref:tape measure protein n=1 Tax=Bacteroides cellulosilyticus TaxID=246787 RepID=UPI000400E65C|nr:tape measure protein [Bacteroides cellulosilyticus]DAH41247.1 MAG TPA: Tail tape measure [Caudoviricetes sp.]